MNSRTVMLAAALAVVVTLGGCGKVKSLLAGGDKPTGQVVATVDGDEITALELRQEMGGFASRDPKVMKSAQQQALQSLILRKLVVAEAKKQKLDKDANHTLQLRRGEDALLAQAYQRKIAGSVAVPTRQEAENYIGAHPEKFADRRILIVEQLVAAPNKIPNEQLKQLNTLDEVKALLDRQGILYKSGVATIDTLNLDSRLVAAIDKLPPNEVFVIPQQGGLVFNHIIETRQAPFGGDAAVTFAVNLLRNQRMQEAVARQLELMRKSAEKSITYNEAYKPTPAAGTPTAALSSAGAAAAPTKAP